MSALKSMHYWHKICCLPDGLQLYTTSNQIEFTHTAAASPEDLCATYLLKENNALSR